MFSYSGADVSALDVPGHDGAATFYGARPLTQGTHGGSALATAFAIPDVETPSWRAVSARDGPNCVTRCTARSARTAAMRWPSSPSAPRPSWPGPGDSGGGGAPASPAHVLRGCVGPVAVHHRRTTPGQQVGV